MSRAGGSVTVICLCAAWCGVCREFAVHYRSAQDPASGAAFEWLDVEDEAERLGDVDVDNFPCVLIGVGGDPVFFGAITPNRATLERLVRSAAEMAPLPPDYPERRQLAALLARG